MRTPYVPHLYGADALAKVQGRTGWLTASVASSIAWPADDVWVNYDGAEYVLHGVRREGIHFIAPSISTPAVQGDADAALSRVYRFTSVLGYYKRGYVDATTWTWGTYMSRFLCQEGASTTPLQGGRRGFTCNHMPVIETDRLRRALAFLREGRRLERVHEAYAFLSFFKLLESQFDTQARIEWVERNLSLLDDKRAVARIKELSSLGLDVGQHLRDSGRCAIAHAGAGGRAVVDPDIPSDRKRIRADLDIVAALANRYIQVEAGIPDEWQLHSSRDRVAPWYSLMGPDAVAALKAGGRVESAEELGALAGAKVSVRLWGDSPAAQFEAMELLPMQCGNGIVKFVTRTPRGTIDLAFAMDVAKGRMRTLLNEGRLLDCEQTTEQDVEDYTRYFHSVMGNGIVELTIDGTEPVDCEVVIPVNIIPRLPDEAVVLALEEFRRGRGPTSA